MERLADVERGQLALELPAQTSYGAHDYVVGGCNRLAHDMVMAWPAWPHFALGLNGPAGAGKTHLSHLWAEAAGAGCTGPAEIAAAGPDSVAAAGQRWVVDFGPLTCLEPEQERALFHLHNLVGAAGGALLYVSRPPLARLPIALADLGSRLAACPAAAVSAPDEAMLRLVIAKLAADRQIVLGEAVVAAALHRLERSFAAVQGFVRAIDAQALADRRQITQGLARKVLDALAGAGTDGVEEA